VKKMTTGWLAVLVALVSAGSLPALPKRLVAQPAQTTGTISGEVVWADGAVRLGERVSALGVSTGNDHENRWVAAERISASALTNEAGRYQIQGLAPGRYHIVTGPIVLSGNYDDVAAAESPHLVTVAAGAEVQNVNFAVVRNPDRLLYVADRVLTVSGKIGAGRYATPGGGVFLLVTNSDGSLTRWHFRRDSITLNRRSNVTGLSRLFWWPGYDILRFESGPLAEMVAAEENVTVSGTEVDISLARSLNPSLADSRFLYPFEVTRSGR
jgi:hypothetical protein